MPGPSSTASELAPPTEATGPPRQSEEEGAVVDRVALEDCMSQTSKIAVECNSYLRDLLQGRSPQMQDLQRLADQQATLSDFLQMLRSDGILPEVPAAQPASAAPEEAPKPAPHDAEKQRCAAPQPAGPPAPAPQPAGPPAPAAPRSVAARCPRSKPLRFPSSLSVLKQWELPAPARPGPRKGAGAGHAGAQRRPLTMRERYLSVRHFWGGLAPAQRRDLLRVSVEEMLCAVKEDSAASRRLLEALALLRLSGGTTAAYWRCPACDARVPDAAAFLRHLRSVHEDVQYAGPDVPLVCTKCAREVVGAYYQTEEPGFRPVVLCMNCCWDEKVIGDEALENRARLLAEADEARAARLAETGSPAPRRGRGDMACLRLHLPAGAREVPERERICELVESAEGAARDGLVRVAGEREAAASGDEQGASGAPAAAAAAAPRPGPAKRRHCGRRFFTDLELPLAPASDVAAPCPCCEAQGERAEPVVMALLDQLAELERQGSTLLHSVLFFIMAHAAQVHTRIKREGAAAEPAPPRFDPAELGAPGLWARDEAPPGGGRDWRAVVRAAVGSLRYDQLQTLLVRMLSRHERALVELRRSQFSEMSSVMGAVLGVPTDEAFGAAADQALEVAPASAPPRAADAGVPHNPAVPCLFVPCPDPPRTERGDGPAVTEDRGAGSKSKKKKKGNKAATSLASGAAPEAPAASPDTSSPDASSSIATLASRAAAPGPGSAYLRVVPVEGGGEARIFQGTAVEPAAWWLRHLVARGQSQAGGAAAAPLVLQWVYGAVAHAEAEEAAERLRIAAADADPAAEPDGLGYGPMSRAAQEDAVLAAYGQVAEAWRHVAAAMDRKRHLRALRDAVAEDLAALRAFAPERVRRLRTAAADLRAALRPELHGEAHAYAPPEGEGEVWDEVGRLLTDRARRLWRLVDPAAVDLAEALLCLETSVLELAEEVGSAEAEATQRELSVALETAASAKADVADAEGALARAEREGPAPFRRRDALDRAAKESEHRELLGALESRLAGARERSADEVEYCADLRRRADRATHEIDRIQVELEVLAEQRGALQDALQRASAAALELQSEWNVQPQGGRRNPLHLLALLLWAQTPLRHGALRAAWAVALAVASAIDGSARCDDWPEARAEPKSERARVREAVAAHAARARATDAAEGAGDLQGDAGPAAPPADVVASKGEGYCHECDEPRCQHIWSEDEAASSCDDEDEDEDEDDDDDCAQSISSSTSFDSAESLFDGRFRLGSNERLRRRAVRRVRRAMLELSENARAWWEDLARARQRALELALVDLGPVVEEAALAVVRGRLERAADAAREEATRDLLRELEDEKKSGAAGGWSKKGGGKKGADKAKKAAEPPVQPKEVAGKAGPKAGPTATAPAPAAKKDSAAQAAAQRQAAAAAAKKKAEEAAYEAALEQRRRELEADAQRRAAAEAELLRHARQASLRELAESASVVQDGVAASAEIGTAAKKAAKTATPVRAETRAPTVVPAKKRASSAAGREPAAPEPAAAPAASNASTTTTAAVASSATAGSPTASATQTEWKRPVTRAPLIVGAGERTASLPPPPAPRPHEPEAWLPRPSSAAEGSRVAPSRPSGWAPAPPPGYGAARSSPNPPSVAATPAAPVVLTQVCTPGPLLQADGQSAAPCTWTAGAGLPLTSLLGEGRLDWLTQELLGSVGGASAGHSVGSAGLPAAGHGPAGGLWSSPALGALGATPLTPAPTYADLPAYPMAQGNGHFDPGFFGRGGGAFGALDGGLSSATHEAGDDWSDLQAQLPSDLGDALNL